jgi:hypothetical protein
MPLNVSQAPSNPSPLWIIALFIALSEAMAGAAAIAVGGGAQLIFAIFAVGFPILVFSVFMWMLVKHPANWYPPWQYTADTPVASYASALNRRHQDEAMVYDKLETAAATAATAAAAEAGPDAVGDRVRATIRDVVKSNTVTIDPSKLIPHAEPFQIPVSPDTPVGDLLDSVYFAIRPAVKPFTYNKSWVLAEEGRKPLVDIGTTWANTEGIARDERPLTEAGIKPGATLVALPASGPR